MNIIPKLNKNIVLDGKFTSPEEWSGALEIYGVPEMDKEGRKLDARSYAFHNGRYINCIVDFVSHTYPIVTEDAVNFIFDTKNDGGQYPRQDDLQYRAQWNVNADGTKYLKYSALRGTGHAWPLKPQQSPVDCLSTMSYSPNLPDQLHLIYEFRAPLSEVWLDDRRAKGEREVGMHIEVGNVERVENVPGVGSLPAQFATSPTQSDENHPDSYMKVLFADEGVEVPDMSLPQVGKVGGFALLATALFFMYSKRRNEVQEREEMKFKKKYGRKVI
jgi:hypothetical protein